MTLYQRVGISDSSSSDLVLVGHDVPSLGRRRRSPPARRHGTPMISSADRVAGGGQHRPVGRSRLASTPHVEQPVPRRPGSAPDAARAAGGRRGRGRRHASVPARSRWPRRWRPRCTTASTCWCRPAPAPASRWPTSCPRCCTARSRGPTPRRSSSRRPRSRCRTRSSSATCRTLVDAVEPLLGRRPTFAILKGRSNYLCKNKVLGGMPDDAEDALFDASPTTALGRDVVRLRGWADDTETGDRDELDPGVGDRAWRQVSVSGRECLGAAKCPYGGECFAEQARDRAGEAEIVVTNHALLAIDALESFVVLPEHDVVVVDEAHELVDRVTGVATDELTVGAGRPGGAAGAAPGRQHRRPGRRRGGARGGAGRDGRGPRRRHARGAGHGRRPRPRRRARTWSPSSARLKDADEGARKVAAGGGGVGVRHRRADRRPLAVRRHVGRPRPASRARRVRTRRTADRQRPAARGAVRRAVGRADQRDPRARRQLRADRRPGRAARRGRARRGRASTSARRSTTRSRGSSTSPATCRRPDATAPRRLPSTSSRH